MSIGSPPTCKTKRRDDGNEDPVRAGNLQLGRPGDRRRSGREGVLRRLFGWEFHDNEVPGGVYTICTVDGDAVAAIAPTTQEVPPHWNSYVTVTSADDAAAKAKELGAKLIMEPCDATEAGRMAAFADPTGAALCLWEPRESIGAARVNDPGCLTWNELHTPDPPKALEFYTGLFGWGTEEMETQDGPSYTVIRVGERTNGGVMTTQQDEPPNWLPYFTVDRRDAALGNAMQLGAQELFRMDMPQGAKIAILADRQGAPFAVFEGEVDD